MRKMLTPLLLFSILMIVACSTTSKEEVHEDPTENKDPVLKAIDYTEYKSIFQKNDDILYVVNFWATWCKPCIEELPHFMEVKDEMVEDKDFKMVLISMDKASLLDTKVKEFIDKKGYEVDVYLLDDVMKMNEWIPDVNINWSGAIPATVFYKNGKSVYFKEGQMTKSELENEIKNHK